MQGRLADACQAPDKKLLRQGCGLLVQATRMMYSCGIMAFRDPDAIAERLDKYADAITAFVVLECIAFVVGLANKDFHDAVLNAGGAKIPILFFVGFTSANVLVWLCYKGEDDLLGKVNQEKSPISNCLFGVRITRFVIMLLANLFEVIAYFYLFRA